MPRHAVLGVLVPLGLISCGVVLIWWAYSVAHHVDRPPGPPPVSAVNAVVAYERAQARPLQAVDIEVDWDSSPTREAKLSLCTGSVPAPCTILQYTSVEVSRFKGPVEMHAEVAVSRLGHGRWKVLDAVEP